MEREMSSEELEREVAALLPDREEMITVGVTATVTVSGLPLLG